jgi:hypothetical protein
LFIPSAITLCLRDGNPPAVNITITVAECLPGYFSSLKGSKMTCEMCPAHTYTILSNQTACEPCSERKIETLESEYSCLQSPELLGQEYNDLEPETTIRYRDRLWRISEGFYPLPSLDDPEELEVCPNEACLPFLCSVRSLTQRLPTQEQNLTRLLCSLSSRKISRGNLIARVVLWDSI